jgi:V/A-type H+/Na+-transporting ATPase subunit B
MTLVTKEYRTLTRLAGPLLFVDRISDVAFGEIVAITGPDGQQRWGQVLEIDRRLGIVQVFSGTSGLDLRRTSVRFTGDVARLDVSLAMLGRVLNGLGQPLDGGLPLLADAALDINGLPINPAERERPSEFIQSGVSAIDGLNTLVRGQKLPIFSGSGPAGHARLAAQIAAYAQVVGQGAASPGGRSLSPSSSPPSASPSTARRTSSLERLPPKPERSSAPSLFINLADDPRHRAPL